MAPADLRWLHLALRLAARRLGQTWPNPAVGAVIVRDGRVLGRGSTAPGGRPHAETVALDMARRRFGAEAIRGATAYVSLEPCAHYGQTPPCADALIDAGIVRVVCPITDPDPRVAGAGFARLAAGGVSVEIGGLAEAASALNAGFLNRIRLGRPQVTLKLAMTLDGRIATRTGESRWITGPAARRRVHLMRANHDAILVGAGTARHDDPMLDVRGLGLDDRRPVRIVADGSLSLAPDGRLAQTIDRIPLWLMHAARAPADRLATFAGMGARLFQIDETAGGVLSTTAMMEALASAGLTRVMCEGGGRLAASLIADGCADRVVLFSAGKVIGGDGRPGVEAFGLEALSLAPGFTLIRRQTIGDDVMTEWSRTSSP